MSVLEQVNSRNALHGLKTNPVQTLQQYRLLVGLQPGHLTAVQRVPFDRNMNNISFGPGVARTGRRIYSYAIVTPTRAHNDPNRFTGLARFGTGVNADFWITERQTGCTVLILDWGGNQYSMAHLGPHNIGSYNAILQGIMGRSNFGYAEVQRANLKSEATQVVSNTVTAAGGGNPQRYIMVQSSHAPFNQKSINLIGVKGAGGWRFYTQTIENTINRLTVRELAWTNWYSKVPYMTY